jgi:phage tail tube protein FII
LPHKLIGMSIHDLTRDIQMMKTALIREANNASYLANRPMKEVVEGQVNIEDLLNPSVGGMVRVKAPGMVREIPGGGGEIMQQVAGMIEYYDSIREQRTGSTRYNQGMDADSLNKTATGISIIQNASTQRAELVARQFAEFLREVFRKLLKLVSTHQDKAEVIRLRGQWVEIDPREWKNGFDMSVVVGLGTGNKDQVVAHLSNLLQIDQQIVELQGGADGPLLTLEGVYNKLKRMVEAMDLKGIEQYYNDPKQQGAEQQQEPQADPMSDPAVIKAHIDAQARIEVARIGAEKDLIIAQMQPPPELMAPGASEQPQERPARGRTQRRVRA